MHSIIIIKPNVYLVRTKHLHHHASSVKGAVLGGLCVQTQILGAKSNTCHTVDTVVRCLSKWIWIILC